MGGSVPDLIEAGLVKASDELAKNFRREVANLLRRESHAFPGAQPVSFARKHLQELKLRDYYVCEKSDGIRCLLYFTGDAPQDGKEIYYFIDRKNDYYWVPDLAFHAPLAPTADLAGGPPPEIEWQSYHTNTLLDGELLYDTAPDGTRSLKYLVFDALFLDGQDLTSRTLDKRLAYFMEKVYKPYQALLEKFPDDCQFIFQMEEKKFQLAYGTEMMIKDVIPKLKHGSDGLIFTCRETPYQYGTDENILKWKPADENTVDFRLSMEFPRLTTNGIHTGVEEGQVEYDYDAIPKFTLYVNHGDRGNNGDRGYQAEAEMYADENEWDDMKKYAVERNDGLEGAVVECHKDTEGRWRLNRIREDKLDGNYVTVYHKVLESIQDAVSELDLVKEAGEIRNAWKKREKDRKVKESEERKRWEMKRKLEEQRAAASGAKRQRPEDE